jgi:hypothetical protein
MNERTGQLALIANSRATTADEGVCSVSTIVGLVPAVGQAGPDRYAPSRQFDGKADAPPGPVAVASAA